MAVTRDKSIDILKGIGIIMVVVGHSGCPDTLRTIIYMVHMPLFFLASGYFLKEDRLLDMVSFAKGKIKSLYVPFIKYAIPILFLHNLLINVGIMSTEYGAQYYNMGTLVQELILRVVFMEVHGEALLGTYWFIQALFFGYILFAAVYSIIAKMHVHSPGAWTFTFLWFSALLISVIHHLDPGIKTVCLYRICMGSSFIWVGHMIRQKVCTRWHLLVALLVFSSIFIIHPASMKEQSYLQDCVSILVSGTCGFLLLHRFSKAIDNAKSSIMMSISRLLSYIGRKSFYIMTFHFLSFKAVSLLIVLFYRWEDFALVGMHPYITAVKGTQWWMVYSVSGVILSLVLHSLISFLKLHIIRIVTNRRW